LHHFIPISSLLANNYTLKRRDFIQMAGLGTGAFMLPGFAMGRTVSPEAFLNPGDDVAVKKRLADAALNAAKSKGASYADVRIGRYLNQYVITTGRQSSEYRQYRILRGWCAGDCQWLLGFCCGSGCEK
jgi:hypothetical protein